MQNKTTETEVWFRSPFTPGQEMDPAYLTTPGAHMGPSRYKQVASCKIKLKLLLKTISSFHLHQILKDTPCNPPLDRADRDTFHVDRC